MDEVQQREYDFFMRMAALAEHMVVQFAALKDDPGTPGEMFKQHLGDYQNCHLYARMIKEGFVLVHRDNVPKVERGPVDESKVPPKYR